MDPKSGVFTPDELKAWRHWIGAHNIRYSKISSRHIISVSCSHCGEDAIVQRQYWQPRTKRHTPGFRTMNTFCSACAAVLHPRLWKRFCIDEVTKKMLD